MPHVRNTILKIIKITKNHKIRKKNLKKYENIENYKKKYLFFKIIKNIF